MDSGPTYPFIYPNVGRPNGITLRDAFAIAALQGLRAGTYAYLNVNPEGPMPHNSEDIARMAYEDADAMLTQRKNNG